MGVADATHDVTQRGYVGDVRVAMHRNPGHAQFHDGRQFAEHLRRPVPTGEGIGDEPNGVTAFGETARQIDDMAEQPTQRRAQHVQNSEFAVGAGKARHEGHHSSFRRSAPAP